MSRAANTAAALAKAKDALLAYTIARDDPGRPAEFPCPTIVAPTAATYGTSAATCATVRIGRLPWKTLGIQELFDSDGEPLWYAVSNKFRPAVTKINSDTQGDLTVYAAGGSTVLSSQVVAVVFAAGVPFSGQNRTSTASLCATTATSIAGNICAVNYLESSSGRNNATNAGPYIADLSSATFNDQVVYVTTADFMPRIEDRIVAILGKTLKDYYFLHGYYPYAANSADISDPTNMYCANNVYVGRLPLDIGSSHFPSSGAPCTGLLEWQAVGNPNSLPAWFTTNQWYGSTHYVIGKQFANGGTKTCVATGDCLTVDGVSGFHAVFILPGIASTTQARPSATASNYLESPNVAEWPTPSSYSYTTTTSTQSTRDRVVGITYP